MCEGTEATNTCGSRVERNIMKKIAGILLILVCVSFTACGSQKSTKSTEVQAIQETQQTVIGESGKRYQMDTSSSLNEETEDEDKFDNYSKLQDTLKKIIKQTD